MPGRITPEIVWDEVVYAPRVWIYMSALSGSVAILLVLAPRWGKRFILVYLFLCALIASVTVIAARSFSSFLGIALTGYVEEEGPGHVAVGQPPSAPPGARALAEVAPRLLSAVQGGAPSGGAGSRLWLTDPGGGAHLAPPSHARRLDGHHRPTPHDGDVWDAEDIFTEPLLYVSLVLIVVTAVWSVKWLNQAMIHYGNAQVRAAEMRLPRRVRCDDDLGECLGGSPLRWCLCTTARSR